MSNKHFDPIKIDDDISYLDCQIEVALDFVVSSLCWNQCFFNLFQAWNFATLEKSIIQKIRYWSAGSAKTAVEKNI